MTTDTIAQPPVVSRAQWIKAREAFFLKEKELTHQRDALNAERRRLPMVQVEKDYQFDGPRGRVHLHELFEGRRQLIIYHFMFDPDSPPAGKSGAPWDEGCPGCSFCADNLPHLAHLHARDTTLAMVSRAPLSKIEPFKRRMGWTMPWYSSFGSDFNYDFHVTIDEAKGFTEWNYADLKSKDPAKPTMKGELPGLSTFLRDEARVYHTYSTFARGLEPMLTTLNLLDLTAYGRQEEWENSPQGWPQVKAFSWLRHHDKYEGAAPKACCQH